MEVENDHCSAVNVGDNNIAVQQAPAASSSDHQTRLSTTLNGSPPPSYKGVEPCPSRLDTLPECSSCEERSPIRLSSASSDGDFVEQIGCGFSPGSIRPTRRPSTSASKSDDEESKGDDNNNNHHFRSASAAATSSCCSDLRVGRLVYICLVSSLKRLRDSYVTCMLVAASSSRSHVGLVMGHHFLSSTNFYPSPRTDDDLFCCSSHHHAPEDAHAQLSRHFGSRRSSWSDPLRR